MGPGGGQEARRRPGIRKEAASREPHLATGESPPGRGARALPAVCADPDPPSGCRYRKVVSNVCEGGVDPRQSPSQLQCPLMPPRGLQVSIRGEAVAVRPREDVLFVVRQEQVSAACCPRGATPAGQAGDGGGWVSPPLPGGLEQNHLGGRFPS